MTKTDVPLTGAYSFLSFKIMYVALLTYVNMDDYARTFMGLQTFIYILKLNLEFNDHIGSYIRHLQVKTLLTLN